MFNTRCIQLSGLVLFMCCSLAAVSGERWRSYKYPKSCPPHETYTSCGAPCQTECATLNQPCLIQNIRCPDGCYCDAGYARDDNGDCIPMEECPEN